MKKYIAILMFCVFSVLAAGCGNAPTVVKLSTMLDYSAPLPNEGYDKYVGRLTESRSCYVQLTRNTDEQPKFTSADMPVMDTYYIDHSSNVASSSSQPGVGPYANSVVTWATEYGKYADISDRYYDTANMAIKATYLDGLLRVAGDVQKDKNWVSVINSYIAANPVENDSKSVFLVKIRSDLGNDIIITYDTADDYCMDGWCDTTSEDMQLQQDYQHKINVIRKYIMKHVSAIDAQGNSYYPSRIFLKDISNVIVEFPVGLNTGNSMIIMKLTGLQHFGQDEINCVWQIRQ